MFIGIGGNGNGYRSINTNSEQYKAAARDHLAAHRAEVAMMTPEERMLYEMLGGEEGYMKNVMKRYDSEVYLLNSSGVAGMCVNGIPESQRHQIINISEEARQSMYEETMRHFIQEKGVANGDTTRRSEVYTKFQLSIPKEDRLKGTWTLQQYETAYRQAFYDAIKASDPNWELGRPFDSSILRNLSREDIDNSLVRSGNRLLLPRNTIDYTV